MSISLVNTIARGQWLIERNYANGYLPLALSIVSGKVQPINKEDVEAFKNMNASYLLYADGSKQKMLDDDGALVIEVDDSNTPQVSARTSTVAPGQQPQRLAVVSIKQPIIKYSEYCGPTGMETFAETIRNLASDNTVAAIVLDIESGGGEADAVNSISAAIQEAKAAKPVLCYAGNGMVASAAYWIASYCDEIYCTYEGDAVGSIGAYCTLVDWESAMAEFYGAKVESVYATQSADKNKAYRDWKAGDSKYLQEETLGPLVERFKATVKANRPNVSEKVFKGAMYYAQEAIDMGLIDGIKTFQETVDRAFELAQDEKYNSNNASQMNLFGKKPTDATKASKAVEQLAAISAAERTEQHFTEANAELETSGLVVANKEGFDQLQDENKKNATDLSAAQASVSELSGDIEKIASVVGLTKNAEGKFLNAKGEEKTVLEAVNDMKAEHTKWGGMAGVLEIDATEAGAEGNDLQVSPELKEYQEFEAGLKQKANNL